jgi:hypothetical protein
MGSEPSCKSKLHPLKKRSAHKSGVTIRSKNGILRLVSPSRFLHFCQQKTFTHPSNTCAAVSIESLNTQKRIQLFEPRPPGKNLSYDLRFFVAPSLDKSSPLSPHITARSPSEYPVTSCPPTCRDISFFVTAPPAYALHAEKSQESLTFLKPSSCCPDSRHPCDATGSRARLKMSAAKSVPSTPKRTPAYSLPHRGKDRPATICFTRFPGCRYNRTGSISVLRVFSPAKCFIFDVLSVRRATSFRVRRRCRSRGLTALRPSPSSAGDPFPPYPRHPFRLL